ncbi:hypothetical protein OEZ85_013134 [Tetradesmus obliquus]|uniref:Uncharacterized protein n=1 Tax=Tetradesmus obliquus TaxID=3088 RepID=A0ABY8U4S0_TETOB|nr:hypothetical protein OEZ85_013134 [Tetradesmus obliquus]
MRLSHSSPAFPTGPNFPVRRTTEMPACASFSSTMLPAAADDDAGPLPFFQYVPTTMRKMRAIYSIEQLLQAIEAPPGLLLHLYLLHVFESHPYIAAAGKATLAIQQYLVPAVMTNVFVGAAVAGVYSSSKMAEQLQWLGNRVIETAVGAKQQQAMPFFSLLQAKQVIRDVIGPLLKDQGKMAMAVALLDAQGIKSYTRAGGYHAVSLARLVVPLLNILTDEQINAMADAYIKDLMQKMLLSSTTTTATTHATAQALKHMLGIAGRQRNNNIPTFA